MIFEEILPVPFLHAEKLSSAESRDCRNTHRGRGLSGEGGAKRNPTVENLISLTNTWEWVCLELPLEEMLLTRHSKMPGSGRAEQLPPTVMEDAHGGCPRRNQAPCSEQVGF